MNWVQVCVIIVVVGLMLLLAVTWLLLRINAIHARTRAEMVHAYQAFLRGDYARLASESTLLHKDFCDLVGEVRGIAVALKETMESENWDPQAHLDVLDRMDAELTRVRMSAQVATD